MSSMRQDPALAASCFLLLLILPPLPVSSLHEQQSSEGLLLAAGTTHPGSAPPNCNNRCSRCTPCTAVQDPTVPAQSNPAEVDALTLPEVKLSGYKPLGWKCRCGDQLYNP